MRFKWPLLVLIIALAGLGAWSLHDMAAEQPRRGEALTDLAALYPEDAKPLGKVVMAHYRELRGNAIRWSAAYFGCLFGSAFLSAMTALVLKLELLSERPKLRDDLAAALATTAALLVTLSTIGDFQRKWQANRLAAAEMENLAYELARPSAIKDLDAVLARIQQVNNRRNRAIVGEVGGGQSEPKAESAAPSATGAKGARPSPGG